MKLNQEYIDNLKITEIPWSRLGTPYGSGENFPKYFEILENIEVKTEKQIKWAIEQISSEMEHQGTLWPVTPFAIVFLMQIFREAVSKMQNNEQFCYLAEELLAIFLIIAESCDITKEMGHSEPLSYFSDMLKEEYLWPQNCDEDEMDYDFSDDLFYSFYYYSYQILLGERDFFEGIKNFNLKGVHDILEILPKKKTEISERSRKMTEKELMLSEQLYIASDKELAKDAARSRQLTRLINATTEEQTDYRKQLFRELFQKIGEHFGIEPPFRCDYGCHISVGENFYANFDCIMLDVCDIVIGDNVMFGPRVCVYTAGHPIDADIRNTYLEYGKRVIIGNNVWVGGSTVINPGVTIGNNVVIGSGSVVTRDIPDNVVAVGNPCRVLREITQKDKKYWEEQAQQYKRNKEK